MKLLVLYGNKKDREEAPLEDRALFSNTEVAAGILKLLDDLTSELCTRHFASLEANNSLYLVAACKKFACVIDTRFKVVRINAAGKLNFLDFCDLLIFLCFFFFFLAFKAIFAVIHSAANRRNRRRSDENEVEVAGIRMLLGIVQRHNTKLFSVRTDEANLFCVDVVIDLQILCTANGRTPP